MKRLAQFFEGEGGILSMTRLLMFLSFPPSTYVLLTSKDINALQWYVGAYVTGYALGKGADAFMGRSTPEGVGE